MNIRPSNIVYFLKFLIYMRMLGDIAHNRTAETYAFSYIITEVALIGP